MLRLFLLFTVVPAVELWLLIRASDAIGGWETLAICIVTGMIGARLAKEQGSRALARIQREAAAGGLPADALIDGLLIFVAGVVLVTPGFITDFIGISLLLPPVRGVLRGAVRGFVMRHLTAKASTARSGAAGFGGWPGQNPSQNTQGTAGQEWNEPSHPISQPSNAPSGVVSGQELLPPGSVRTPKRPPPRIIDIDG